MYEEAYQALRDYLAEEKDVDTASLVSRTYASSGYEKARELYLKKSLTDLKKKQQSEWFDPTEPATVCALLGNRDEAFKWLEEAYQDHGFHLIYLKVSPDFDNLRSDPRYADLLRRMNLAP
jgi:hypothetical protein